MKAIASFRIVKFLVAIDGRTVQLFCLCISHQFAVWNWRNFVETQDLMGWSDEKLANVHTFTDFTQFPDKFCQSFTEQ
jgi:hypothetical protein